MAKAKAKVKAKATPHKKAEAKVAPKAKAKAKAKAEAKAKAKAEAKAKAKAKAKAEAKPSSSTVKRKSGASKDHSRRRLDDEEEGGKSTDDDYLECSSPEEFSLPRQDRSTHRTAEVAKRQHTSSSEQGSMAGDVTTGTLGTASRESISKVLEDVFKDVRINYDGTIYVADLIQGLRRNSLDVPEHFEEHALIDTAREYNPVSPLCLPLMTPGLPRHLQGTHVGTPPRQQEQPSDSSSHQMQPRYPRSCMVGEGVPDPIQSLMNPETPQEESDHWGFTSGLTSHEALAVPQTPLDMQSLCESDTVYPETPSCFYGEDELETN
eukprot:gnl/MRDRNA2_/MRDRNA2_35726_c0_seq1.p1 gnl/MRDRNA2_/MRDRNA2_35726_c0~~gnl/MRDRNA2_/MRDRNA2_35726_c0_seq1.p1  ORF type:complete len:322 (+),score=77.51 gnl/MRDRNA2_/MRDRNA2_35726_c0_seq1:182-1147(+)